MRTCAAALVTREADPPLTLMRDAIECLLEASNLLDVPEPVGEPMEVLTTTVGAVDRGTSAVWGGELPAVAPRPCPSCGGIDARKVRRHGRKLQITCPRCEHEWEYP
jgi:hypothetical protein